MSERSNPLTDRSSILSKSWRKLRRLHPIAVDLSKVELIRAASRVQLRDPDELERLILELGLNDDGLEEFPPELHRRCGHGLRIWQYPSQLSPYLVDLSALGIRSYLELGVRHGGTFVFTVEYLNRFHPLERAVAVDIMPCPTMETYGELEPRATFCRLNTQSAEFESFLDSQPRFDLVLIDANHDEREARREFEAVRRRADVVALHDIDNVDFPGIRKLWGEIRLLAEYECCEYVRGYQGVGPYMGIGLAVRRDRPGPPPAQPA